MIRTFVRFGALAGAAAVITLAGSASGATIEHGTYRLSNHPDGSARPPLYGARLDELYNVTSSHDIFTFDFDHADSAMYLDYNGTSVHIYGVAYGGRDTGGAYAADAYRGLYTFNFLYNIGVQLAESDDDVIVEAPTSSYNYGTLLTPLGDVASLRDGHYTDDRDDFRFGDENNDLGHRGFAGLSGWGWMFHKFPGQDYYPYVADSDWLFTAELVPTPGTLALVALSGVAIGRRRR